jgi:flagellar protein FlaG
VKVNSISPEIGAAFTTGVPAKQAGAASKSESTKGKTIGGAPFAEKAERPAGTEPEQAVLQEAEKTLRVAEPIVNGFGLGLQFSLDKPTGTRVIKVIELESGDIVRQIPPEEVLAFLRHFEEGKGVFLSIRL